VTEVVLDSSAILADFHREPGGDVVREAMRSSRISAVNYAEVLTHLVEMGLPPSEARFTVEVMAFSVVAADQSTATTAGLLHEKTRRTGVSLGDRFCLALALETGLPVLTTDRIWKDLDVGVEVILIR
jgi:ribonuclease VapC